VENNTPQAAQGNYAQAPYPGAASVAPIVSVKEWLITMLIMIIPIVNIVMIFVYAFGGNSNPSKANYFKASLIMACIVIVLYIILMILFALIFGSALMSLNS